MNKIGKIGEELARHYLYKKGYNILEQNYRVSFGEIDIIAEKNNYIVTLENENKRQNNEIEEKNAAIDWMEKSINIYMSVYGCF